MNKIKSFFNSPKPIIITLIVLLAVSVLVIYKLSTSSKIYISSVNNDDVSISTIHAFINNDMHMFYSTPAAYNKEDYKIYGITAGYYVKTDNEYMEFLTQSEDFDSAESLTKTLEFYSAFNYIESNNKSEKFSKTVKKNFENNLYFIVKVKKDKNSSLETIYEKKIEMKKLTK